MDMNSHRKSSLQAGWESLGGEGRELLQFLSDQMLREQELFWVRFTGFAAIHAGLVAFAATGSRTGRLAVAATGFILALFWFLAQWMSWWYTNRWKRDQRLLLDAVGFDLSGRPSMPSSTMIGVATSIAFLVLWPGLFLCVFFHWF